MTSWETSVLYVRVERLDWRWEYSPMTTPLPDRLLPDDLWKRIEPLLPPPPRPQRPVLAW